MMWSDDPVKDAERYQTDLEERQPFIRCAECGKRLYIATDYYSGDAAWNFGGHEYYCDECSKMLFRKELTE